MRNEDRTGIRYDAPANGAPPSAFDMSSSAMARALPNAFTSGNFLSPSDSAFFIAGRSLSATNASAALIMRTSPASFSLSPETAS